MNLPTDSELERASLPGKLINLTHVFVSLFMVLFLIGPYFWMCILVAPEFPLLSVLFFAAPLIFSVPLGVMTLGHWAMGHFPPLRSVKRAVILSRLITLFLSTTLALLVFLLGTLFLFTVVAVIPQKYVEWFPMAFMVSFGVNYSVMIILIWWFGLKDAIYVLLPDMAVCRRQYWALEDEKFGARVWISVPLFKLFGHYVLVVDNRKYELRLPDRSSRVPIYSTAPIDAEAFQLQQELEYAWTYVGWTRYSHAEIDQICKEIMGEFGTYDVYRHNCRHFLEAVWKRILHVGHAENLNWLPYDKSASLLFGKHCAAVCLRHLEDLLSFSLRCLLGKDLSTGMLSVDDIFVHLDEIRIKAIDMGLYFPDGRPSESPSSGPSGGNVGGSNESRESFAWLADFIEASGPSVGHTQSAVVGSVADQSTGGPRAYDPEEGQLIDIEMGAL